MMRHFYYTIQTLLHERGVNIIKIISMTLGIFVGILLFSCVAFQLSYYNFCPHIYGWTFYLWSFFSGYA